MYLGIGGSILEGAIRRDFTLAINGGIFCLFYYNILKNFVSLSPNKAKSRKNNLEAILLSSTQKRRIIKEVSKKEKMNPRKFSHFKEDLSSLKVGTGIKEGGILMNVDFIYKDGNVVKTLYKKGKLGIFNIGGIAQRKLSRKFDFVPYVVSPTIPFNKGYFQEFIEGETLCPFDAQIKQEEIFNNLWQLYEKGRFNVFFLDETNNIRDKNLSRIKSMFYFGEDKKTDEFLDWYKNIGVKEVCRVHGDLHYRNIMDSKKGIKIIDWDNFSYGIPYEDFYNFHLTSGFVGTEFFEREKKKFIEKQKEMFPQISQEDLALSEFNVLFKFLNLYYKETSRNFNLHNIIPTLCRQSRKALEEYVQITNETEVLDKYDLFLRNFYGFRRENSLEVGANLNQFPQYFEDLFKVDQTKTRLEKNISIVYDMLYPEVKYVNFLKKWSEILCSLSTLGVVYCLGNLVESDLSNEYLDHLSAWLMTSSKGVLMMGGIYKILDRIT